MIQASTGQPAPYPWGHEEGELERIISTGRYLGDLTEHVLRFAGIERGMRVLDARHAGDAPSGNSHAGLTTLVRPAASEGA